MTELFLQDVVKFAPKNWEELADIAKFMKSVYAEFAMAAAIFIHDTLKSPKNVAANLIQLQSALDRLDYFRKSHNDANDVYLVAISSHMENKIGDFNGEGQILDRITNATSAGILIKNF